MNDTYKVMVVDDSAVVRGLLVRSLEQDGQIEVVSSVSNGDLAIKALDRHKIDVVVLDIEMPVMDGLTALPLLIKKSPNTQVIMASTLTRKNAQISMQALQLGAADYLAKPQSGSELSSADQFKRDLLAKVKALGRAATGRALRHPVQTGNPATPRPRERFREEPSRAGASSSPDRKAMASEKSATSGPIVTRKAGTLPPLALAIASSTGGPQALFKLMSQLSGGLRLPVFITQHMPATFTSILAQHIERASGQPTFEAEDGQEVQAGSIYVAPGNYHMTVEGNQAKPVIKLLQTPPENFCRPSADPMLRSLIELYRGRVLLTVLTGMGSDGSEGAKSLVAAGGTVIAQDEATSVVWGMPGAVAAAGVCSEILPLQEIGPYLNGKIMRSAA